MPKKGHRPHASPGAYTMEDADLIDIEMAELAIDYQSMIAKARLRGNHLIYPNQERVGKQIYRLFAENEDCRLATLIAPTQWGKTGALLDLVLRFLGVNGDEDGPRARRSNIYALTGQSDIDWHAQTCKRMEMFVGQVFYRNKLADFVKQVQKQTDVLILIDEAHIGTGSTQQLKTHFQQAGLLDVDALRERRIWIVQVSATPGVVLLDAEKWERHHTKLVADLDDGYLGLNELRGENRIQPSEAITPDVARRLCNLIEQRWGPDHPKYHIIRMYNSKDPEKGNDQDQAIEVFVNAGFVIKYHNSIDREMDIDQTMAAAPRWHTILVIKGFWRASKTFPDAHIGVCYETYSENKDYNTEVQGLPGRLTGYGKQRGDLAPIIFCKMEAIDAWIAWYAGGCDYRQLDSYKSAKMKIRNNKIVSQKPSVLHASVVAGLAKHAEAETQPRQRAPIVMMKEVVDAAPAGACVLTTWTLLSPEDLLARFGITSSPEMVFKSVPDFKQALDKVGVHANVSYSKVWQEKVANICNFFLHPDWAGSGLNIFNREDGNFVLIERHIGMLNAIREGKGATIEGVGAGIFAHMADGRLVRYVLKTK